MISNKKSLRDSLLAALPKRPPSGWYYLTPEGDFFFTLSPPEAQPTGRIKHTWPVDTLARESAWVACVEAKALEANPFRVKEALSKWKVEPKDTYTFAQRAGIDILLEGSSSYMACFKDFTDKRTSQTGWGSTPLEAIADLVKQGFVPLSKAAA
jgi:hypothetical protein